MSLIQCPDCNKDVSDAAPACPNCGRPIAAPQPAQPVRVMTADDSALTRNRGCGDLIIFAPLIILAIIAVFVIGSIIFG